MSKQVQLHIPKNGWGKGILTGNYVGEEGDRDYEIKLPEQGGMVWINEKDFFYL